jgi:hypothetical protein
VGFRVKVSAGTNAGVIFHVFLSWYALIIARLAPVRNPRAVRGT